MHRLRASSPILGLTFAVLLMHVGAVCATAAEDESIEQIVSVLREKGLIDDVQQNQILAKHVASVQSGGASGFLSGLDINGDFRLRYDTQKFESDGNGDGMTPTNRSRFRYRLRVGVRKQFDDQLALGFRIVSGTAFNRGQDQELGNNPDFAPDTVQFDRAYIEYKLPETSSGMKTALTAGKMENPFRWGKGPDTLVVDQDLSFEGATLATRLPLSETAWLFGTTGAYIVQELPGNADPKLYGVQVGGGFSPAKDFELGLRGSTFFFRSLDSGFMSRAMSAGNLSGAFPNEKARIGEVSTYLTYTGTASWPVTAFAQYAKNFSAESSGVGLTRAGDEDRAYGFGVQTGNSKTFVSIGVAFYEVEANAVMSQFTDPDFFDGLTNSRGYAVYLERALGDLAFLRIQFYNGDSLRDRGGAAGPFAGSLVGHDRKRLQTDLVLPF